MKKYIYPILLLLLTSLTFYSCSSESADPVPSVEGKWRVEYRTFTCTNETYQKEITDFFRNAIDGNKDVYNYTFGPVSYEEESFLNNDGEPIRGISIGGTYSFLDKRTLEMKLALGTTAWNYNAKITELNTKEILMLEQEMTSVDIENMFQLYRGFIRPTNKDVTGVLTTKAVRITE